LFQVEFGFLGIFWVFEAIDKFIMISKVFFGQNSSINEFLGQKTLSIIFQLPQWLESG
jgi:hypothetical protein